MTDNPLSPELIAWGATFTPASASPSELYWKLIRATGPQSIGGNHHLYVDTLDEAGNRVVGVRVTFYSINEQWPTRSEAKPGEPFAVNLPLFAGGHAYGVYIDDGLESDHLWGVGLADHGPHQSFTAIFQRTRAADSDGPTPVDPPAQGMTALEAVERAQNYFAQGQQLLDYARGQLP